MEEEAKKGTRGAAEGPEHVARVEEVAEAEIDDLDVAERVQEAVLELQVPVHHPGPVHVLQPLESFRVPKCR
jgi:hypothetical protein